MSRHDARGLAAAAFQVAIHVSPGQALESGSAETLTLRRVLDAALDRTLLMSESGAIRLRDALNSRLPPVWPGEPPFQLELARAGGPDCFAVTVPPSFHNRLQTPGVPLPRPGNPRRCILHP